MTQIERVSLREQVRRAIRSDIVTGNVRSGEVHTVGAFAERLGVSATPVREALLDLANERLVEVLPNRGFRVRSLSNHDLDELVELRLIVEVAAIDRLAGRLSSKDVEEVRGRAEQTVVDHVALLEHRDDGAGRLGADDRLHRLVLVGIEFLAGGVDLEPSDAALHAKVELPQRPQVHRQDGAFTFRRADENDPPPLRDADQIRPVRRRVFRELFEHLKRGDE